MTTVLLVIHIMVAAALVAVVLWQRSEGGALGIGGGGGGFLTGRGTANLLTRTTAVLAACFFITSILLTLVSKRGPTGSAFEQPAAPSSTMVPADPNQAAPAAPAPAPADNAPRGGILDKLK
jgi:preprotein translocase subunit SecG